MTPATMTTNLIVSTTYDRIENVFAEAKSVRYYTTAESTVLFVKLNIIRMHTIQYVHIIIKCAIMWYTYILLLLYIICDVDVIIYYIILRVYIGTNVFVPIEIISHEVFRNDTCCADDVNIIYILYTIIQGDGAFTVYMFGNRLSFLLVIITYLNSDIFTVV